ncbi:BQ2448_7351 [Microbotryum intermedium]|uniref:BQ2448_7351 protein n=1 Tax=Microbotryum intermedium TaxID=269621 RepID=A0A238FJV3_9BASI|nr:BQ2448_7351 [Microbotryum intermedium]
MSNPFPGSAEFVDTTCSPRSPANGTEPSRTSRIDSSAIGSFTPTTAGSLEPWQGAFPWSSFTRDAASARSFRGGEVNSEWSPNFPSLDGTIASPRLQQQCGSYVPAEVANERVHDARSGNESVPSFRVAVDHPPSMPRATVHSVFDPWALESNDDLNRPSSARTTFAPAIQNTILSRYTPPAPSLASTTHVDLPPLPIRSSYTFSSYPRVDLLAPSAGSSFSADANSQHLGYPPSLSTSSNSSLLARESDLRPSSAPWVAAGAVLSTPPHAAVGSHLPPPPTRLADWSTPHLLPTPAIHDGAVRSESPHSPSPSRGSYETSSFDPFPRSWYRMPLGTSPAALGLRPGTRSTSSTMAASGLLQLLQSRQLNEDQPPLHSSRLISDSVSITAPVPPPVTASSRPGETRLRSGLPDRSTWAMWCGNIPSDATEAELLDFFSVRGASATTAAELYGVESIHLIARSNCAFVNYTSEFLMQQAITRSNGVSLRANDRRCKPLVCRRRMREDDAKSGVGAQRGAGLHLSYIAAQTLDSGKMRHKTTNESQAFDEETGNSSGDSTASTTSSFFLEHFPKRFFVLKAKKSEHLEESIRSGFWSTQGHNEDVLDQAFRTSLEGVFLFFSANRSGGFAGYARMIGPIFSPPRNRMGSRQSKRDAAEADRVLIVAEGGTPFPVQWMSTRHLPFTRTRSILNSFNNNREVKISRDGTEIEPNAGSALLRLWD